MGNTVALCSGGARLEELQGKVEEQEKTIAQLRRQSMLTLGKKDVEIDGLRGSLQELHAEVAKARDEGKEEGAERVTGLDKRIEELEAKLEEAEAQRAENEVRKAAIADRDAEIARMTQKMAELREAVLSREEQPDYAGRSGELSDFETALAETTAGLERLRAEQEEARRLRAEYDEHKSRLEELEPRVDELSSTLADRDAELRRLREQSQTRTSEMERLSAKIGELEGTLADAEETKTALTMTRTQMRDLQVELETKRMIEAEVQRMQKEMEDQRTQLQRERRKSVQLQAKMSMEMLSKYRCFGVPIERCISQDVDGYSAPVPTVLVTLRDYLMKHGGVQKPGIFRLAPKQEDINRAKDELNRGEFESTPDVSTAANLIGAWFREQPKAVLAGLDLNKALKQKKPKDAWQFIVKRVPEPQLSAFAFLVDIGAAIAANAEVNKMTPMNLGIVFTPNVFEMDANSDKAMEIMTKIKQLSGFIEMCIQHRMETPR